MPAQILHTLFGEDVIAEIYRRIGPRFGIVADKALEKITGAYRTAFILGCQGPDIFYHNQRTRPVALEYGGLLHRRGYGFFTANLLKMGLPDPPPGEEDIRMGRREKGVTALGVYALGFMTHAILDRRCHPYIVYKSQHLDPEGGEAPARRADGSAPGFLGKGAHPFFERIIDALMLQLLRGREAAFWDQGVLAETLEKPPPGLKELLGRALRAGFPERAGPDWKLAQRIDNTFLDAAWFYRLTDPQKTGLRVSGASLAPEIDPGVLIYLYPEHLPQDIDFLNLDHGAWYDPGKTVDASAGAALVSGGTAACPLSTALPGNGGADTRSFPEIYAGAVEAAADSLSPCMIEYLDSGVFPIMDAARRIGNGGLSIQDETGKPCAPVRTAPLPLERVWREQADLRGVKIAAG
jgi:hypothetical protein